MSAKEFFEAIARRYDRDYALSGHVSRERLARVLAAIATKKRVLVLGLGTGRELPALLDAGHEVQGIELAPTMIALCNQRARRVPIHEGDFYDPLPFSNESFDVVLALHGTLAHPPNDDALTKLASEVARVLSPDGLLVAEVPAAEGLAQLADVSAREGARKGVRFVATSATTFVHHDERAHVSIAGIALDAEGWREAFAPALVASVTPLGAPALEYLVSARAKKG